MRARGKLYVHTKFPQTGTLRPLLCADPFRSNVMILAYNGKLTTNPSTKAVRSHAVSAGVDMSLTIIVNGDEEFTYCTHLRNYPLPPVWSHFPVSIPLVAHMTTLKISSDAL